NPRTRRPPDPATTWHRRFARTGVETWRDYPPMRAPMHWDFRPVRDVEWSDLSRMRQKLPVQGLTVSRIVELNCQVDAKMQWTQHPENITKARGMGQKARGGAVKERKRARASHGRLA